ncbi:ribonuclease HI [Candidatus Sneabacter namystus]|uniref:ribonuclease H n=1 Tax=Candidatus Sneabacter namystus TaxID=2601646 RepID=A0A5C0UIH7_9RICK|nr:ribonuclease HI [Candidatus Sneabacter namystus]QEK39587.1 ribonuclease HI [Candidatus Sneabacter namystus]
MDEIIAYTDGACSHNPGPGGWGVFILFGTIGKFLKGSHPHTTNNQMEMMAAIKTLRLLKTPSTITIYTDSQYLQLGASQWIYKWEKSNWKTSNKAIIKNLDMWKEIYEYIKIHKITWKLVKAHAGNVGNEIADSLATLAKRI